MAGQCTPHSLFCEKRECAVHGGREKTGARLEYRLLDTQVFSPRRGASGGLDIIEWTALLFPLPLPWRKSMAPKNGGQRSVAALARTEREVVSRSSEASAGLAAARTGGQSLHQPPKPPPAPRRGLETCTKDGGTPCASPVFRPPAGAYFLFSFGPCTARFLFSFWQGKEKMGGAMNQPSSWL